MLPSFSSFVFVKFIRKIQVSARHIFTFDLNYCCPDISGFRFNSHSPAESFSLCLCLWKISTCDRSRSPLLIGQCFVWKRTTGCHCGCDPSCQAAHPKAKEPGSPRKTFQVFSTQKGRTNLGFRCLFQKKKILCQQPSTKEVRQGIFLVSLNDQWWPGTILSFWAQIANALPKKYFPSNFCPDHFCEWWWKPEQGYLRPTWDLCLVRFRNDDLTMICLTQI